MNPICERMKQIRLDFHLTQTELAKRLGVTNAHISKIEKGKTVPSGALIKLVCKELNLNELWLAEGILPIFLEDIAYEQDLVMMDTTRRLNAIIKSNIPAYQLKTAHLHRRFIDLISVDHLDESTKGAYWDICGDILCHIEEYSRFVKDAIVERQIMFAELDMKTVCDEYTKTIAEDLRKFLMLYEKTQ